MSSKLLSPPQPEVCLTKSYKSRGVKGGTVIAEDVWCPDDHNRKLLDPDEYRRYIGACRHCGHEKVHALCFRCRTLYPAETDLSPKLVDIRLYVCPADRCGAVYTVLPAFVARHLWRDWETVQDVSEGRRKAPRRTRQRWFSRLASSARQLVQLFKAMVVQALKGSLDWMKILADDLTRGEFITALCADADVISPPNTMGQIAAWIHQVEAGVRLM